MISHFFIDRPIFASVISIVITLAGSIAVLSLPITQYPNITPPTVQVAVNYPGASAKVVADTIGAPIEQQVNGVENMLYMSSQSGNDGSYNLTVTFDLGTDLNTALVMVQNRVTLAIPQLPVEVQRQGLTIKKKAGNILLVVNFYSPNHRYDDVYLSNFATIYVRDELFRIPGVSDITYLGQRDYSIRAWLDPEQLAARNMNAGDVVLAIQTQSLAAAAGQMAQAPNTGKRAFQEPLDTLGRLTWPEQFGQIVVKARPPLSVPAPTGSSASASSASQQSATSTLPEIVTPPSIFGTSGASTNQFGTSPQATAPGVTTSGPGVSPTLVAPPPILTPAPFVTTSTTSSSSTPTTAVTAPASSSPNPVGTVTSNSPSAADLAAGNSEALASAHAPQATGSMDSQYTSTSTVAPLSAPDPAAALVRLRDVARVELGATNYNLTCTLNGQPSVGLAVFLLPGANALDTAEQIQAKMQELRDRFPEGIDYTIGHDITPFIRESVADVIRTLFDAVALVALVTLMFLQNWRAALIPLIAVPVAIIGTFAVMLPLGFSLNNISLFGLVLAIGIVVDDAIVVVENVERWLEHGLAPREAARRAMSEVTSPVVAVALVLCAVFIPCAFISGITGQFFRQFAVTIATSTVLSAINSLTLSPALAAILLRPRTAPPDVLTRVLNLTLGWAFRLFERSFSWGTRVYERMVGGLLRVRWLALAVYAALVGVTYWEMMTVPLGFIPQQDQGYMLVNVQLPDSASLRRTQEVMAKVEQITHRLPGVRHTVCVSGLSFLLSANSSNFGSIFVILEPFENRRTRDTGAEAIMAKMRRVFAQEVPEAIVSVFGAPPVPGIGVAGGFKLMVEDRAAVGVQGLQRQTDKLIGDLKKVPGVAGAFTLSRSNTPQLWFDVDRTKVMSMGVPLVDFNGTLQTYLGSTYVNNFNAFGRYWQVNIQADGRFRDHIEEAQQLKVRNNLGKMVPLGSLATMEDITGPVLVIRYNLYTAAPVNGNLRPGASTGAAIDNIDALTASSLPRTTRTEWTELTFMQIRAGNTGLYVFGLAVVFVFLALAALYESWSLPLAVILVVPMCLLCSVTGVAATGIGINIFVQIGFVVLVGLACKNAILIVEFARSLRQQGKPLTDATREASALRLRPIMMTSMAFILGVLPLVVATGAGAEMRQSLGIAVFCGMLGVTAFGIFLTPVFFHVIEGLSETPLFTAANMRWYGSLAAGLVGGLLIGVLAAGAKIGSPLATLSIGMIVGVLTAFVVLRIKRRPQASGREEGDS